MSTSYVAGAAASTTNNDSASTSAIDTTTANLIVANCAELVLTTAGVVTDSKGNTWTQLTTRGSGSQWRNTLWYCINPTVGSGHTFTCTGNTNFPVICVVAFACALSPPVFDAESGVRVAFANTIQPGSITPAEVGEVLVAGVCTADSTSPTIDSSFSTPLVAFNSAIGTPGAIAYKIKADAAAENPTWSWTNAGQCAASMAAFKAAAASGRLFLASSGDLSGIGAGGPFFRNPL
jgi:hypothetical protein